MKKFYLLVFCVIFYFSNNDSNAQVKLNEGFEGTQFPPAGWSLINVQSASSSWTGSKRTPELGTGCVVSNFSPTLSNNFLVTKSFVPSAGDSLFFSFRQTFWNVYKDTFNVYISTTDSLVSGMTTLLAHFHDGFNYPSPLGYGNYALSLNGYAGRKVWVGFQHININGDNIRLDNVSSGVPLLNEVGVVQNLSPVNVIAACPQTNIVPAAVIKNFGELSQLSPFSITYKISGPVNYQSVKYDTLCSGNAKTIYFDTMSIGGAGIYDVKIFVNVTGDQNHSNDTLHSTFNVYESNFGGGLSLNGGYYFSNSSLCAVYAPAQPEFCWKDTTGSASLILNGTAVSGAVLNGNVDDGYFRLGGILSGGNRIKFFNNLYDSVFISTNGVIGFKSNDILLSHQPMHFTDSVNSPVHLLSALWTDIDFGNSSVPGSRLSYKLAANQLIITYDRAPVKSGGATDFVSFQICIELKNPPIENSKILIQYNKGSSGAGFISGYLNNTIPAHCVGLMKSGEHNFLSYRYSNPSGVAESGRIFDNSTAVEFGPHADELNNKCSKLTMKILFESMVHKSDTVRIALRNFLPPYKVLEERKTLLDTAGIANCIFTIPDESSKYFFEINHRNSVETWSRASGETFGQYELDYDFSQGASMAFGNNMKVKNNVSYIYKGDINADGVVDVADLSIVDNDVRNFHNGYLISDLNGDNSVDVIDLAIVDNNSFHFVSAVVP